MLGAHCVEAQGASAVATTPARAGREATRVGLTDRHHPPIVVAVVVPPRVLRARLFSSTAAVFDSTTSSSVENVLMYAMANLGLATIAHAAQVYVVAPPVPRDADGELPLLADLCDKRCHAVRGGFVCNMRCPTGRRVA